MLLTVIILLPVAGALALLLTPGGGRANETVQKWIALLFALATFALSLVLPFGMAPGGLSYEQNVPWIGAFDFGINYHVGIDGLSLWLVLLTTLLVPLALLSSWNSIHYRLREFLIAML